MSGVKSIYEVKDLYDLIELYDGRDRSIDGLLEAGEVSAEEVAAGDQGGVSSANYDVKDGFLSPWEVARMRGFTWEQVRSLRIANQIEGRAFRDIDSLKRDLKFKLHRNMFDAVCKAGTPVRFYKNGMIRSGVLGEDLSYGEAVIPVDETVIPAGSSFTYNQNENAYTFLISRDAQIVGHDMRVGTAIYVNPVNLIATPPRNSIIVIDGIAYSKIERRPMPFETRTLARAARVSVFPGKSSLTVPLPAGQEIVVNKDTSGIVGFELSKSGPLFGFECSEGVGFRFSIGGPISVQYELESKRDGASIEIYGNKVKRASLTMTGQSSFWDVEPEGVMRVRLGGREYAFSAIRTDAAGRVMDGLLAEDAESPWGTGTIRSGSKVSFLDDGTLLDGSMRCFHGLHPKMSLEHATPEEVNSILTNMQHIPRHVLDAVKGISVTPREDSSLSEMDAWGYADPDTMEITLIKESFDPKDEDSNPSSFQHEAAHIFTYVQEESESAFESEWMRAATMVDVEAYDKTVPLEEDSLSVEWKAPDEKISRHQPRYGCARAYGCKNYREDVATQVELVTSNHALYRDLIDPRSTYYAAHPNERRYAPVYRAKLDLLYRYGFITMEHYRAIASSSPLSPRIAEFCAREVLNCQ